MNFNNSINSDELTTKIKKKLIANGASIVGIGNLAILSDSNYPLPVIEGFRFAISIGIKLSDKIIDELIDGPTKEYAQHYSEINSKLDNLANNLVKFLNELGFHSIAIEASKVMDKVTHRANFPHKTAAILSGIGWIGKSNLLITHVYGPRVRLVTILTDAPLIADQPQRESNCGSCQECVDICPVKCLSGKLWEFGDSREKLYDVEKCSDFVHKQEKIVGKPICGLCIRVCPYGQS
ncbi:MAG: 4Fe-4S double cluster binding domain-containing protein [Candidatus Thorarchaeota archaeon]